MDAQTQTLSRIGILGDVHAQNGAVKAALAFLHALPKLSAIVCSGDLVTGAGDANEAITLLREAGVVTVRGNHDRWLAQDGYLVLPNATAGDTLAIENRAFVSALPPTRTINTVSGPLLLCHGVGRDDMAGIYPGGPRSAGTDGGDDAEIAWLLQTKELSDFRYLIAGHTHARMVRPVSYPNGDVTTIINAGTLLPDKKPGFLVCDFANQTATVYHLSPPPDFTITEGQTVSLRPSTNPKE